MILDSTVILQTKTSSPDSEGMSVDVWTANNTFILANIQSNNKAQFFVKEYTFSDASYEFIMFTEVNTSIVKGTRIVDGSDSYDVMRVVKWPNHYEVICAMTQR